MHHPVIAFIGAGNMSSAIIAGLITNGYPAKKIIAANRGAEKLKQLSANLGIQTTQNNSNAAKQADVVVLGVKPFLIKTICEEIKPIISNQLIISVAAGKTISSIMQYLTTETSADITVVRAMPNTPCLILKGVIGLFTDKSTSVKNRDFVVTLFENVGEIVWLENEKQIDIVTALSGSGPAYYFYLTEALIKAGVELGLEERVSQKLVTQTAIGATAMLNSKPLQSAESLRKSVTSPHGTTAAAINVFDSNKVMEITSDAVAAGTNRGEEMSKETE
ncbi:MAG: pyrroline-5-carboxylate reductase [Gammaproteobacteria bacterium]|nr:pyrroline-5-carboxylate reductase [Gammaproteobacteria bacterium]